MDLILGPLKFWNISIVLISVTLTLATRPADSAVSLCWNGRFRSSSFSVAATSSSAPVWSHCYASLLHFHHLNFDRIKSLSQLVFESLVCLSSNSHCVLKINSTLKTYFFKKNFFDWRIIALQCCISFSLEGWDVRRGLRRRGYMYTCGSFMYGRNSCNTAKQLSSNQKNFFLKK